MPAAAASIAAIRGAVVLRDEDGSRTIIAPRLGGRVLTTILPDGTSTAWLDAAALRARPARDCRFHNVGGQDRLWIGPEAGPFGFFFEPGEPSLRERWRVPRALDRLRLRIVRRTARRVVMAARLELVSRRGERFSLAIERTVEALARRALAARLGPLPPGAVAAGSVTTNTIVNVGRARWSPARGIPQIWILGQFPAGRFAEAAAPYRGAAGGRAVEDRYFGRPGRKLLRVERGLAILRADGRREAKFGLAARAALGAAYSWDPDRALLTVVRHDLARGARYGSFLWDPSPAELWSGDAFQSYNSGDGTFFELESVSPARALRPGERSTHRHETLFVRVPVKGGASAAATRRSRLPPRGFATNTSRRPSGRASRARRAS